MKKITSLILILAAAFFQTNTSFAGVYDNEINLLNENKKALLQKADFVSKKNKDFLITWYSVAYQLKLVGVDRFKVSRTGNAELDIYRNLINESVHLSHSFSEYDVVKDKINYLVQHSAELCREADWLCGEHQRNQDLIRKNASKFGQLLQSRKSNLDLALKKWSQRQVEIFLSDQARIRFEVVQGAKLDQLVSRLSSIFFNLNNKVRMAIIEGNREKAEDALSAIVWFRSVIPVFFTDKLMTEYSRTILDGTLKVSVDTEASLRNQVKSLKYKTAALLVPNRVIASVLLEALNEPRDIVDIAKEKGFISESDVENDPAFKDFSDSNSDFELKLSVGSCDTYENGKLVIDFTVEDDFDQKSFSEKSVPAAKAANGFEVKGGSNVDKGILRISEGKVAENVSVENQVEIVQKVDFYVRDRFNEPTREHERLSSTPEQVKDLLDNAQPDVHHNFKAEFEKLKTANEDLKSARDAYQKVVETSVRASKSVHNQIKAELNESVEFLKNSEPMYSKIDLLPRIDGSQLFAMATSELHSALNLNSGTKLDDFEPFVKGAEFSFGGQHSLDSIIVQDAINGRDSIESQVGRNYKEKKVNYQLSRFENYLSAQKFSGQMTAKESYDFAGSLSKFAIQNKIGFKSVTGVNRHKAGSFKFKMTERFKRIASEAASIGFGFTPIGFMFDIYSLISGHDFFTGAKLTRDEMIFTAVGLTIGQGALFRNFMKECRAAKVLTQEAEQVIKHSDKIAKSIETVEEFNSITHEGPLSKILVGGIKVSETYRSGAYRKVVTLTDDVKLYRVYGGSAQDMGRFWSRNKPEGPMQVVVDLALDPSNNVISNWVEITVPKGTVMYEGVVGPMAVKGGQILGGGNQVFIEKVYVSWKTNEGSF